MAGDLALEALASSEKKPIQHSMFHRSKYSSQCRSQHMIRRVTIEVYCRRQDKGVEQAKKKGRNRAAAETRVNKNI